MFTSCHRSPCLERKNRCILTMADVNRLVFAIMRFLEDQKTSGGLTDEAVESIEVAIQCLETGYGFNTQDPSAVARFQVQRHLLDIFNAQLSLETDPEFTSLSLHEPTPEEKEEAEKLKNKGNDFMKAEKFSDALECYSQALKHDNKNAVYYCNRAASYSKLNKHQQAIDDCQKALTIDPLYSKAYGRMGIAYSAVEDHESAIECYRKALELDPDNQSYQNNLEISEQKLKEAVAASGFGVGSAGGMPDMSKLLNNPALVEMATSMMGNPQMQQLMQSFVSGMGQEQQQGQPQGAGGLSGLVQMGQQFAQAMQQQNPELVEQLRGQMGQPNSNPEDNPLVIMTVNNNNSSLLLKKENELLYIV
ncbi:hypothetical protein ScPMuIL_006874 [Solemya velum]